MSIRLSAHLPTTGHLLHTQLAMTACNHAGSIKVELAAMHRIDEVAVIRITTLSDQNLRLVTADEHHLLKSVIRYAMNLLPLPCRPILRLPT
jgi:hypothetical protein